MTWRYYTLLALLGLLIYLVVAAFQHSPGYMDADYYAVTGKQLATGKGFSEPFLWNYLDNPAGIPHPSHAYWMPLASLLAALVPAITGQWSWFAARLPFILVAVGVPPLTACLSYSLTSRLNLALISGLLAAFSGYYLSYMTTTDTFGIYMVSGGLFFLLIATRFSYLKSFVLGIIAGLMHLARADGFIWVLIAFTAMIVYQNEVRKSFGLLVIGIFLVSSGYMLVMAPWYIRNQSVFGTAIGTASSKVIWMTDYDQLFSYPADQITFSTWRQIGLGFALQARLWALELNLGTMLGVQGLVFILPLTLIGLWQLRKKKEAKLAIFGWLLLFGLMTVLFPFAGARGGFFHSGAALQPFWWAVAPLGLESTVGWMARKRGWLQVKASRVFMFTQLLFVVVLTVIVVQERVVGSEYDHPTWDQEYQTSLNIEEFLALSGADEDARVMIANPPGFYFASGRAGVVIPDGDIETAMAAAIRYGIQYLVLEEGHIVKGLQSLYENPEDYTGVDYMGEIDEARIFIFQP